MPPKGATSSRPRGRPPSKATGTGSSRATAARKASGRPVQKKKTAGVSTAATYDSDIEVVDAADTDGAGEDEEDLEREGEQGEEEDEEEQEEHTAVGENVEEDIDDEDDDPPKTIPPELIRRLLHEFFEDKGTRMTKSANEAVGKYIDIFVREAVARACHERPTGVLEVEDLEKLAPQLLLDL